LEIKNCPGPMSAAQMTEAERRAPGITTGASRVPLSIDEARLEARSSLEADSTLYKVLGKHPVESY
ncbi:hypothetical protein GGX14DRAFT_314890, partial [Mycena pura]